MTVLDGEILVCRQVDSGMQDGFPVCCYDEEGRRMDAVSLPFRPCEIVDDASLEELRYANLVLALLAVILKGLGVRVCVDLVNASIRTDNPHTHHHGEVFVVLERQVFRIVQQSVSFHGVGIVQHHPPPYDLA